jgi:hypothetical protein
MAILTLLLGGGAVHSTVVPEPTAPAQVQIAEVEHATATGLGTEIVAAPGTDETVVAEPATEPITGRPAPFPGIVARSAAHTRAPPQFPAA